MQQSKLYNHADKKNQENDALVLLAKRPATRNPVE